jgi:hypothetical protein
MPIVMTAEIPASVDMYDAIYAEMGIFAGNLPEGMIAHYAAQTGNGMLIFDVWESKEAFEQFAAGYLAPAVDKVVGGDAGIRPTLAELYNEFHQ